MTKATRNLLITVGLLLLLCLVLMLVIEKQDTKVLFLIFSLVWGALFLWLSTHEIMNWAKRKNAQPEIPKVNPSAGAAADNAFGVPASTACGIESDAIRRGAALKAESEGDALNGKSGPAAEAPAEVKTPVPAPSVMEVPNAPETEKAPVPVSAPYIGHVESRKFHLPTCQTLPIEKNRVYFMSREEAVARKFTPCSYCNP